MSRSTRSPAPPPSPPIGIPALPSPPPLPRMSSTSPRPAPRFHFTSLVLPPPANPNRLGLRGLQGLKLALVALELLALPVHDLRRRVGDEALVAEHPSGALDLLAQPVDLELCVAVC